MIIARSPGHIVPKRLISFGLDDQRFVQQEEKRLRAESQRR